MWYRGINHIRKLKFSIFFWIFSVFILICLFFKCENGVNGMYVNILRGNWNFTFGIRFFFWFFAQYTYVSVNMRGEFIFFFYWEKSNEEGPSVGFHFPVFPFFFISPIKHGTPPFWKRRDFRLFISTLWSTLGKLSKVNPKRNSEGSFRDSSLRE